MTTTPMQHPDPTPQPDALPDGTPSSLCPVQQDVPPKPVRYYSIMEGIDDVRKGFAQRLYELRAAKGVSAREMSLSLGQGTGYISNLENGHNLPSMTQFFAICEYLGIMPDEFFSFVDADKGAAGKGASANRNAVTELAVAARSLEGEDVRLLLELARKLRRKETGHGRH